MDRREEAGAAQQVTIERATVKLCVAGAHMRGMPLNHELSERGGVFVSEARTSPRYRFFALKGTVPLKPGLVRTSEEAGAQIAVELWSLPVSAFGDFVATLRSPMVMGSVELEDGSWVSGFLCEPYALEGSLEITAKGGWKAFLG